MNGYVYIIQSEKNQRYYIGSTQNVSERLLYHNSGKVAATRNKGPWIAKYVQEYPTTAAARRMEYKLKRFKNSAIIDRIVAEQLIKIGV